jgi:hypothetical protein
VLLAEPDLEQGRSATAYDVDGVVDAEFFDRQGRGPRHAIAAPDETT